jgi:hypothetical protein
MTDASPPRPTLRQLIESLLSGEARLVSIGAHVTDMRRQLLDRALEFKRDEGVAPTLRAAGLGQVILTDPKPKVVISDQAAWQAWVTDNHPTEAIAIYRLPVSAVTEELQAAFEACDPVGRRVDVEVNSAWQKRFLDTAGGDSEHVLAPVTGELVDGLMLTEAAAPGLSVRLDPEAKARAAAELEDPVAAGIVSGPLGSLALAVGGGVSRETVSTGVLEDDPWAMAPGTLGEVGPFDLVDDADGDPDEPEPAVSTDWLNKLTAAQLKDELRRRGRYPLTGTKAELVARILDPNFGAHTAEATR